MTYQKDTGQSFAVKAWAMLILTFAAIGVRAEIKTLGYYELGEGSTVTYAVGPQTLHDNSGHGKDLQRQGEPLFVASTPSMTSVAAAGALQFNGKLQHYTRDGALFGENDNFGLEVWVNAAQQNEEGLHGAVENGDGSRGYVLGQMNDRWVAFIGSVGATDLGAVQPGQWTHLALVREGDHCVEYLNGAKVATSPLSAAISPYFRIGTGGLPTEGFHGLIHAARAFTFEPGKLEAPTDFLLNAEQIRQRQAAETADQRRHITELGRPQLGVVVVKSLKLPPAQGDWLIHRVKQPVQLLVKPSADQQSATLVLNNGLVSRSFYVSDNLACTSLKDLGDGAEFIRSVQPEMRLMLNGQWYEVGGLHGQPERSYLLDAWLPQMHGSPTAFRFVGITTSLPKPRYPWQPKFNAVATDWPPRGLCVAMHYRAPEKIDAALRNLTLTVYYEMYEGLPVVAKWFTLDNDTDKPLIVNETQTERLAVPQEQVCRLHVESDYSFHTVNNAVDGVHEALAGVSERSNLPAYIAGGTTTLWMVDPEYDTWATPTSMEDDMEGHWFRNLMISRLPMGPDEEVAPGAGFKSFITFELLQDSEDRERQSLGIRRFYAKLAPQVTENMLGAGTPSQDPVLIKKLIDQMAECGFERFEVMPWPGIQHDNLDPTYVAKWRDITQYALSKGIVTGGYELMVASRGRGPEYDVVNPATGKPGSAIFGQSVCIASKWADIYYPKMWKFIDQTGFRALTPDGPYHGDACAATNHPYHRGLEDSQWAQWKKQVEIFHECQRRNMWAPAPDWYFLNGESCTGMGYREASANLPRELGRLLYRQYMYDGTWYKIPTMGGMSVALIGTYNDDPRAMLEPLSEHRDDYEKLMIQTLGYGAQTDLRANRLFDSEQTRAMVIKWVTWFKKYRDILNADVIHVQRPDGRDFDCIVHVNPFIQHRGLALFFNPLGQTVKRNVTLPLYYTGLVDAATVHLGEGPGQRVRLDAQGRATLSVAIAPYGFTWYLIEP
jgi:hypothetical protein